eukprot:m.51908 g.51908  ORF g.51908 m.51908 type:complete len:98 (+) comp10763_c0_seq1:219-512(+)
MANNNNNNSTDGNTQLLGGGNASPIPGVSMDHIVGFATGVFASQITGRFLIGGIAGITGGILYMDRNNNKPPELMDKMKAGWAWLSEEIDNRTNNKK